MYPLVVVHVVPGHQLMFQNVPRGAYLKCISGVPLGFTQDGCEIWDSNIQILNVLQVLKKIEITSMISKQKWGELVHLHA